MPAASSAGYRLGEPIVSPVHPPHTGYRIDETGDIKGVPATDAPHKNADIICLWARGVQIEVQSPTLDTWSDVPSMNQLGDGNRYLEPSPIHPDYDYMRFRVKK
jgi:hypothetical protein